MYLLKPHSCANREVAQVAAQPRLAQFPDLCKNGEPRKQILEIYLEKKRLKIIFALLVDISVELSFMKFWLKVIILSLHSI